MRKQKHIYAWLMCVGVLVALGCTVEQEQPAEAPDVSVDVDPGRWPEFDVDWADVNVGTTERTVTVPVVRVEKETRQITVPYIDIAPAGADTREERTISLAVDVPTAGWNLHIEEIRAAEDNLWVIGRLEAPAPGAATAQMVSRVSDHVVINAPEDLDVRTIIVGARPDGVYNQQHRFVDSTSALANVVPGGARTIYRRGTGSTSESRPG